MVKFGGKPQQIFENKILDDLYETRCDHLKAILNKLYKKPEEIKKIEQAEEELYDAIDKFVEDEKIKDILLEKLNEYEGIIVLQEDIWECLYYKMGFTDGICFKREIKEINDMKKSVDI